MFVVFGIFLQNNLHSVFVVFVVFEIIFPKKILPCSYMSDVFDVLGVFDFFCCVFSSPF